MDLSGCQWGSFIIMTWLHVSQWPGLTLLSLSLSVWWLIETTGRHHAINSSTQTVQTTSGQAETLLDLPHTVSLLSASQTGIFVPKELLMSTKTMIASQSWCWSEQAKPNGFYIELSLNCDERERYNTALCPDKTHWFWPGLFSIVYHLSKKDPVPC